MDKGYEIAIKNTKYNKDGKAVTSKDDEWLEETEWDEMYEELRGTMTETEYLTANSANRERLLRSIRELEESKRRATGGIMEKLEAIVKMYIPEAIKWEFSHKYSAEVNNPDNGVFDGLYESYVITYTDSYDAEYDETLGFKNDKYFGRESEYRKMIQPIEIIDICQNDINLYQLCTKYTAEDQRSALIFELLERDRLNKNTSIRDYVTINKQEKDAQTYKSALTNCDVLREIYECVKENNRLLVSRTNISTDCKIFFRSIELLAKSMVDEEQPEARKNTADKICELLEDYISDVTAVEE